MKLLKEIFGYVLGGILFVGLMPTVMWLLSGRPDLLPIGTVQLVVSVAIMIVGLTMSIWSIVYMRCKATATRWMLSGMRLHHAHAI